MIFIVSNGVTSARDRGTYPETKKYLLQNGILVYGIGQGNSLIFRRMHHDLFKFTTADENG